LHRLAKAEIRRRISARGHRLKLDQKIDVAACRIEFTGCRRAEEPETADIKFTTQIAKCEPIEFKRPSGLPTTRRIATVH
jgi:hypothetical protein